MRLHQLGDTFPFFLFPLGCWVFVSGSAHEQLSLSDFILDYLYIVLLNATLNFLWYLDNSKHSGLQFELHTHSHLLVVNINRNTWNFQFPLLECYVPFVCFNASIIGALVLGGGGDVHPLIQSSKPAILCIKEEGISQSVFYYCIWTCQCGNFNPSLCHLSPYISVILLFSRLCHLLEFYPVNRDSS